MKNCLVILMTSFVICGCSSTKTYENTSFPASSAKWTPVNPEYFDTTAAKQLLPEKLAK